MGPGAQLSAAFSPAQMPVPQAILFDVYGTLFDVEGHSWAAPDVVATMRQKQLQYTWLLTLMGEYRTFREVTRSAIAYAIAFHEVHDVSVEAALDAQARIPTFADVSLALNELLNFSRVGVLSNGDPESLEQLLEHAGIRDRFEWIISADEACVYKPEPSVYGLASAKTGFDPSRLLLVSSNGWDVGGAASAGLNTAWVNRNDLPPEGVGGPPGLVVSDLRELIERLTY